MSGASPADRRLAEIAVLVVMVLWAGNFIVVKSAVALLPPIGFTFLRFLLASITLLVLLRWREGSFGLPRRDVVPILALGGLGFGVYQMLWTTGLTTIAAGDSALIIAATPVLVALLAVVARSDVLTPVKLAGVAHLVRRRRDCHRVRAGVVARWLARRRGNHVCGRYLLVDLHAFGAPYLGRISPLRATAWATLRGPSCWPRRGRPAAPKSTDHASTWEVGGAILYSGLLSAGISNVIVQNGVMVIGPTRTAAFQFLVPALAVVMAAIFLLEPIRPGQVLGGAVIVGGVMLTRIAAAGRRDPADALSRIVRVRGPRGLVGARPRQRRGRSRWRRSTRSSGRPCHQSAWAQRVPGRR